MTELLLGDNKELLEKIEDESIDALVTDPPYLINFMGKDWDKENSPAGDKDFWALVLKKMKPGAHGLIFGHSRQHHRVMTALEDAGFEIRDCLMWLYGSGFPKSHNISIAIDKQVNGMKHRGKRMNHGTTLVTSDGEKLEYNTTVDKHTALSTESEEWEGWGTALKPAYEPIIMVRRPIEKKLTIAKNVLKHGVGGINIDACRVGTDEDFSKVQPRNIQKLNSLSHDENSESYKKAKEKLQELGRFPANVMLDEEAGRILDGQAPKTGAMHGTTGKEPSASKPNAIYNDYSMVEGKASTPKDRLGGASRFFYCPKVSKRERNLGCNELEDKERKRVNSGGLENDPKWAPVVSKNNHPTVKPIALMKYLIKLITPPTGKVLDPFMGSGSTGMACVEYGVRFVGMEMDENYYNIAKSRIQHSVDENAKRGCVNTEEDGEE
tara:strand:+ start:1282 stop:2595 length:1314 start_codon:yes stop_codon:yes gene_type:complete